MQLVISSKGNLLRFLILGLFIIGVSAHASETPQSNASGDSEIVMGKVEYELPHQLGILTLQVPLHWVGARAEGIEVGWIDQDGSPFKDNVTLTMRDRDRVGNTEGLLDNYVKAMIESVEHTSVTDVEKAEGRRSMSFERTVGGQEITQTMLAIYTESADKSYLLTLNHSRLAGVEAIDLNQIKLE